MPLAVTGVAAGPSDPQQSNLESISPSQCGINLLVDGNGRVLSYILNSIKLKTHVYRSIQNTTDLLKTFNNLKNTKSICLCVFYTNTGMDNRIATAGAVL